MSNGQHGLIEGVRVGETRDAYSYDEHGRLSSFESTGLNPLEDSRESLVQIEYERSVGGRLTKEILEQGGVTRERSYTYNGQGRLESVTEDGSTKWYQYDRAGNRVHAWSAPEVPCDPTTQMPACDTRYDADDRVVSSEGVTHQFDARGVLKSKTSPGGITEYGYDLHGALESVESTNGLAIEYENDPFSRRAIKKRNGVVVSQYVWSDGLRIQAELDRFGGLKHRFLYGTRVNVPDLILRTVPGGTKTYRVITDHLGSPLMVVNVEDASDIWLEAEYDVWGKVTRLEVEGVSAPLSAWPIPFGYAGGLYDGETGLVRFGARDYDPTVGRWTSKDPILFGGGQSNLYVYVENDPVNFVDPRGLWGISYGGSAEFVYSLWGKAAHVGYNLQQAMGEWCAYRLSTYEPAESFSTAFSAGISVHFAIAPFVDNPSWEGPLHNFSLLWINVFWNNDWFGVEVGPAFGGSLGYWQNAATRTDGVGGRCQ